MRLLLDCSPLSVGGGVQVGLATIHGAVQEPSLTVALACSPQIAAQLPDAVRARLAAFHCLPHRPAWQKHISGRELAAIEAGFRPDVVFTVFGPSYWAPKTLNVQGFALGKMLYPELRNSYGSLKDRWTEQLGNWVKRRRFAHHADYFVVETSVVRHRLAGLMQIDPARIFVIGNSYSPMFGERCAELSATQRGAGDRSSGYRVFVPANFYAHKNLLIVPPAAAHLRERGLGDVRFIFTIDPASAHWRTISAQAAQFGCATMIETVGSVRNDRMADHYLAADATLCSSLVESSTAVFPETFFAGRPLIASDREYARAMCGPAARYFEPTDPAALADAVAGLCRDPEQSAALVAAGRQQLSIMYPTPAQKWALQLQMLKAVLEKGGGKRREA